MSFNDMEILKDYKIQPFVTKGDPKGQTLGNLNINNYKYNIEFHRALHLAIELRVNVKSWMCDL